MERPQLNLARKWRSRTFDELVGQELSVRVLKNSLYLNQFFPVYLFSGQRGCGKTSTARIFAAALNCEVLQEFQNNPKKQMMPCLSCSSCMAMQQGNHPDFIEIDAASHTGVDNVRQIIDAATLLPVLGRKKIYLIDEAHMLSKAAFNALLKILEEPPTSVLFILATTDLHKILETVKSRCFQLLFKAIDTEPLLAHLEDICAQEKIEYEKDALELLIKESDGSARDALNALEQVRLSHDSVSVQAVHALFGHLDDGTIVGLVEAILCKEPKEFMLFWQENDLDSITASYVFYSVRSCLRAMIWLKYGIKITEYFAYSQQLKKLSENYTVVEISSMVHALFEQELLFLRISDQHIFIQNLFLQLSQKKKTSLPLQQTESESISLKKPVVAEAVAQVNVVAVAKEQKNDGKWQKFLEAIEGLDDPLLFSIFKQAHFGSFNEKSFLVTVRFAQQSAFFSDWLHDTKQIWQVCLTTIFGSKATIEMVIDASLQAPPQPLASEPKKIEVPQQSAAPVEQKKYSQYQKSYTKRPLSKDSLLDVSDKQQWKKTHLVLHHFPGMVCKEQEGSA